MASSADVHFWKRPYWIDGCALIEMMQSVYDSQIPAEIQQIFPPDLETSLIRAEQITLPRFPEHQVLIQALYFAPFLTMGFYGRDSDKMCLCPLSLDPFVSAFGLRPCCSHHHWMTAHSLVTHLKKKSDCVQHQVVLTYVSVLFQDFLLPGMMHMAFYVKQSAEWKRLENKREVEFYKRVDEVEREIADEERLKKKREKENMITNQQVKIARNLCNTVEEYKRKRDEELRLMKRLHIQVDAQRPAPSDAEMEVFRRFVTRRAEVVRIKSGACNKSPVKIMLPSPDFDINELFENGLRDNPLLFQSCNGDVESSFLQGISVSFLSADSIAEDAGGVARDFLSKLWAQLGDLRLGGKHLFESTSSANYLEPAPNVSLDAYPYYRAIGRIMAACIYNGHHISDTALPHLYRTRLFLGRDANHSNFWVAEALTQLGLILASPEKYKEARNVLLNYIDPVAPRETLCSDESDGKEWQDKARVRQAIQEYKFDPRKTALSGLQEGILLIGDAVEKSPGLDSECMHMFAGMKEVHCAHISRTFFAPVHVHLEAVIASLVPRYPHNDEFRSLQEEMLRIHPDGQRKGHIVDVIRFQGSDDLVELDGVVDDSCEGHHIQGQLFLRRFLFFISGYSFLPRHRFPLYIEFYEFNEEHGDGSRYNDALPDAHTCDCTIKFPLKAYADCCHLNGQQKHRAQVLREKLLYSLHVCGVGRGSFQME